MKYIEFTIDNTFESAIIRIIQDVLGDEAVVQISTKKQGDYSIKINIDGIIPEDKILDIKDKILLLATSLNKIIIFKS